MFLQLGGWQMDYKEILIELIKRIDDEKILESLFYIIQKLFGRGI